MTSGTPLTEESPSVQAHLNILQSVIQRMASNSASCKAWCIGLVSAILVVVADKGKPSYLFVALIPIVLFLALDTYYLALEKAFRDTYGAFIRKLHAGALDVTDLYAVTHKRLSFRSVAASLASFSIWPFYVTLAAMALLAWSLLTCRA